MEFKHPKYYAELRKQGRKVTSSQAIADKQASPEPESTSSRILKPEYKRTSPRSGVQATRINVFFLCFT